ncbi:hypothetical protein RRG08_028685 [Elysia crispata]|uniref:Uncharacterized protein n=1 Tax=Elysia crispata TaxID=231223 RepID=A0AAE1B0M1_9GAST|nr:hypothetical protein RRG08_028685 [Elysia crispata]
MWSLIITGFHRHASTSTKMCQEPRWFCGMAEKLREIFITRKNLTLLSNSNAFAQIGQLFREHHRKFRVLVMSPDAGHNVVRGSIMDAGKPSFDQF